MILPQLREYVSPFLLKVVRIIVLDVIILKLGILKKVKNLPMRLLEKYFKHFKQMAFIEIFV